MREFLSGELTAFEFDEELDVYRDADDEIVRFVASVVWYHYDDCEDHYVCLSKPEWDFFQRLLLLLASDCRLETSTRRIWSARQLVAVAALTTFTSFAFQFGWGQQLLVLAIPFGFVSMVLAYWPRAPRPPADPYLPVIYPFATLSDLETAYHATGFRKVRYPRQAGHLEIRSPFMNAVNQIQAHLMWCLFAPLPLFFQCFPRSENHTQARAT